MGQTNVELLTVLIVGVLSICIVLLAGIWRQRHQAMPDRRSVEPERRQLLRRRDDRTLAKAAMAERRRKIRPASQGGGDPSLATRLLEGDTETRVRATLGQSLDMFRRGQIGLETFTMVVVAEQRAALRKIAGAREIQPANEHERTLLEQLLQENEAVLKVTEEFLVQARSGEIPSKGSTDFNH